MSTLTRQISSWSIQPFGHNAPRSQTLRTDRTTVRYHTANRFTNGRPTSDNCDKTASSPRGAAAQHCMSLTDDVTGMTYLLSQQRCVRVSYVTLPQQLVVLAPVLLVPITLPVHTRDLLDDGALSLFAYLRLGSWKYSHLLTYLPKLTESSPQLLCSVLNLVMWLQNGLILSNVDFYFSQQNRRRSDGTSWIYVMSSLAADYWSFCTKLPREWTR